MIKEINFKTSFYKEDLFTKFKIKQGDTVKFNVTIEDAPEELQEHTKARILLRRSDKTVIYEEIDVTIDGKVVTFIAPNGTADKYGTTYGELEFSDDSTYKTSTFVFVFDVVSKAGDIGEAIESKDEIFIIREIRDFINQTKEDLMKTNEEIANIKGAQEYLELKLEDAENKANILIEEVTKRDLNVEELKKENTRAENNLEQLDVKNEEAESNLKDLIVLSEEAIQNIDMIKGNIINLIVDEKGNALEEIQAKTTEHIKEIEDLKDKSIEDITTVVDEGVENITILNQESIKNIDQIKDNSINLIADLKDDAVNEIEDIKDNAVNEIEDIKDDAVEELNNAKINMETSVNEAKIIFESLKEENETATESISTINQVIQSSEESKLSLENTINNAAEKEQELDNKILGSNIVKEALDTTIEEAKEVDLSLSGNISNGSLLNNELNDALNNLEAIKNELNELSKISSENISELNILHPESNIRIETLRDLIEQAKHYEQVVRAWIAEREPAEDLTEVNRQLEELYRAVGVIEAQFNNYYTKEETNELMSSIDVDTSHLATKEELVKAIESIDIPEVDLGGFYTKEEVDGILDEYNKKGFIGAIGLATKFAKLPKAIEDAIPEVPAPPIAEAEYVGKVIYKYSHSTTSDRYKVLYMYNNPKDNYYPYLYTDTNTGEITIKGERLSSAYKTLKGFYASVGGVGNFIEDNTYSLLYDEKPTTTFYYSDVPIYSDINKSSIYRNASGGEFIGNLDFANEEGRYSVDLSTQDFLQLQNAPIIKIKGNRVKTVLHTYKKDNTVFQEITIEGITYTRRLGEQWTGLDTSSFMKKDIVGEIKGIEAVALINEVDEIFASCPVVDTHQDVVGITDFRADADKYYRVYTYRKTNNEMFYLFDNGKNSYYGYTSTRYYFVRYIYTNGAWARDTSTYQYASVKNEYFEIYQNTLPVCYGSGTTSYDKTNIIKEATTGETKAINDFNNALSDGRYTVNCAENESINNAPVIGNIEGILEVKANDTHTLQELILSDNSIYKRVLSNDIWTAWKQEVLIESNIENRINTVEYTNADGMLETYKWVNNAGMITMWIDVKMSENEYNMGSTGLIMKTLNIPTEAQVFSNIINASITSYCREGENTLSRIVQNAEIIDLRTVRGRWRHTDNTYPRIDRFTIMVTGY